MVYLDPKTKKNRFVFGTLEDPFREKVRRRDRRNNMRFSVDLPVYDHENSC